MREIKVKGWHILDKKWVSDNVLMQYITIIKGEIIVPTNVKLVFFTGLKDKNGKEIYEGSILEHPDGERFEVVWDESSTGFRAKYLNDSITSMLCLQINEKGGAVVIGTIYENEDLLK